MGEVIPRCFAFSGIERVLIVGVQILDSLIKRLLLRVDVDLRPLAFKPRVMEPGNFSDFAQSFFEGNVLVILDEGNCVSALPAREAFVDLLLFGDIQRRIFVVVEGAKSNGITPFVDNVEIGGNDGYDIGVFKNGLD